MISTAPGSSAGLDRDLAEGKRGSRSGSRNRITARRDVEGRRRPYGDEWVINGEKTFNMGIHRAAYDISWTHKRKPRR